MAASSSSYVSSYQNKMSPQAILLTVVLGILTIFMAVVTFMNFTIEGLVTLIFWIILFAVSIYDTQCLVQGNCFAWSWVRTVLWAIIPIIMIAVIISALARNKKLRMGQAGEMRMVREDEDPEQTTA